MLSTLLEVIRASHEKVVRLERLIVKELQNEPASVLQSHLLAGPLMLSLLFVQVEIHEDKDTAGKVEIAALGGQTTSGTNVFSAFYDRRLKQVFGYTETGALNLIMRTVLMVNPVISR